MELQQLLQNYGVMISFSGPFSQEIIEELADAVKRYLAIEATSAKDTFTVLTVFIEQTQNIKKYSARQSGALEEQIANSGIVAIGKTAEGYFVSSGNLVAAADGAALAAKLENIAGLDNAGLKKLFKEQMKREIPPGSTGAGLGLIDMARKACEPLQYSLVRLDETLSFFTLQVRV